MVGAGLLMILLALLGLFLSRSQRLEKSPAFLKILIWAIALPYICNLCGWIMAEMGRQPWIVYGLQRVENAVSPNVSAGAVLTTLIGFTLVYALLAIADAYLLVSNAKIGPEAIDIGKQSMETGEEVSLWT